jgi:hypothetical protein
MPLANLLRAASAPILLSCALLTRAHADGYVGNAWGNERKYTVFEFTNGGNALKPVPSVHETAWPSAIRTGVGGSIVTVYLSDLFNGRWSRVHRWVSNAGDGYVDGGVVLTANGSEPNGIGPAVTTFDGSLYRIFYLVRGPSGPGLTINLATSSDGINFSRQGVVYTADAEAPGGLSLTYACTDGSTSYLVLHAYSSGFETAKAVIVSAASPDGPYSSPTVVISPSGVTGTISGFAGNNFATLTGPLTIGRHILVKSGAGSAAEPYTPVEISGRLAWFDRALAQSHSNAPWADAISKKVDLSFITRSGGTWTGAVTGYGHFPGVVSEYTARASAPSVTGPWTLGPGHLLQPFFNSGNRSSENPEPIRTNSSCLAE